MVETKYLKIQFWVHQASPNSFHLHILSNGPSALRENGSSKWKFKMVSYSKIIVVDQFSNFLRIHWHAIHHLSVKNGGGGGGNDVHILLLSPHPLGKEEDGNDKHQNELLKYLKKKTLIHILEKTEFTINHAIWCLSDGKTHILKIERLRETEETETGRKFYR